MANCAASMGMPPGSSKGVGCAPIPSSHTRCERGSSKLYQPSSPVAHNGPTNRATTTRGTQDMNAPAVLPGIKLPWRRPPYLVALSIVLAAVAANGVLGNLLWLGYSLVGVVIVAATMTLDRALQWHLPDRLLWWCGVPLAMHYLGGSLSGLHQWGTNGLYYALPWWDNLVHFLGAGAVGVAAAYLLAPRLARQPRTVIVCATAVASLLGLAVELYEFTGFLWFGTVDQGYYTNTVLDLYYNTLGGFAGAWLWMRPARQRSASKPSPDS